MLQAGENLFVDTIPLEISTLPNLRILHLERNAFSGPLPEEIGNANALGKFEFDLTNFYIETCLTINPHVSNSKRKYTFGLRRMGK